MKEAFFLSLFEIYVVFHGFCSNLSTSSFPKEQLGKLSSEAGEMWLVVRLRKHDGTQAEKASSGCWNCWGSEGRAWDTGEDPQEGTPF